MDKTGPLGTGPIGRGMGPCSSGQAVRGRGRGFRHGGGAAWGMMPTTPSQDEEKGILEQQKDWLETQLATITQRLQGLGKSKESE
jgi:hypothetical protein